MAGVGSAAGAVVAVALAASAANAGAAARADAATPIISSARLPDIFIMTKYSPSRQCAFLGRAYRRAVAGVLRFDDAAGERDFILASCFSYAALN